MTFIVLFFVYHDTRRCSVGVVLIALLEVYKSRLVTCLVGRQQVFKCVL